jgi:MOSC domain-containing protein YiiM
VAKVVSVNVGAVRTVEWHGRAVTTGIWKAPVHGRVAVRGVNLAGDDQADRRVHGGPDKAVYAYAVEDYEWWSRELGQELGPGTFGENLTVEGIDVNGARNGDRWAIGSVLLEVTRPRVPCSTFAGFMDVPHWIRRFALAYRPGAYLRVLTSGELTAGDTIEVTPHPDDVASMREVVEALYSRR